MGLDRIPRLEVLDTLQFGQVRAGCAYLLCGDRNALVDVGTAASAARLADALRGMRIHYAFLTHVHLDHAGAAGHLADTHPETLFVAHPRAIPHLADPTRLVEGARAAGPGVASLYGQPLPVPRDRLVPAKDGQTFSLAQRVRIQSIHTPGHAPHHVCYFEPGRRVLFLGDAAGHCGVPADLPLTVPPRFDRKTSRESLARLLALRPRVLAFAHFGLHKGRRESLAAYSERVDQWLQHVGELRESLVAGCAANDVTDRIASAVLAESRFANLSPTDRMLVGLCVRGALLTLDAESHRPERPAPHAGTSR